MKNRLLRQRPQNQHEPRDGVVLAYAPTKLWPGDKPPRKRIYSSTFCNMEEALAYCRKYNIPLGKGK